MKTIGDRIKYVRGLRGWSQEDLAVRVGISQGTIGHIESGRNTDSKYLVQMAAEMRVRAEWLATGKGDMYGDWPFNIPMSDYQKLDEPQKEILDKMITGYIVGCLSVKTAESEDAEKRSRSS